jgi:hypothetical protein
MSTTPSTQAISTLRFAEYNPRKIREDELEKLVRSINEFGFVEPVVARAEDGLVIGGHQRLTAYRRLLEQRGLDEEAILAAEVPVMRVFGLDDAKTRALNIALNRISGEWDYEKLTDVLRDLATADVDTTLSGFSAQEVADFFALAASASPDDLALGDGPDGDTDGEALLGAAAEMKRSFSFKLGSDDEAGEVRTVLQAFGMTGPKTAPAALLAVVRAAQKVGPPEPVVEPKNTRKGGARRSRKTSGPTAAAE